MGLLLVMAVVFGLVVLTVLAVLVVRLVHRHTRQPWIGAGCAGRRRPAHAGPRRPG